MRKEAKAAQTSLSLGCSSAYSAGTFLPSFVAKIVPRVDLVPTWTMTVVVARGECPASRPVVRKKLSTAGSSLPPQEASFLPVPQHSGQGLYPISSCSVAASRAETVRPAPDPEAKINPLF